MTEAQKELLEQFPRWVQTDPQGPEVAESTAKKYTNELRQFIVEHGHPYHASRKELGEWRESLISKGLAASTINLKLAAIRAAFKYLRAIGKRDDDPTIDMSSRPTPKRLPRPIADSDIQGVIERMRRELKTLVEEDDLFLQDVAILEVLYGSGLRRSEAAGLELRNIAPNNERDSLRVIGKGDKERLTIMTKPEYKALREWCLYAFGDGKTRKLQKEISADAAFDELRKRKPSQAVFLSSDGSPVRDLAAPGHFIYNRLKALEERYKVNLDPHRIRHSFATELLNAGTDLRIVSHLLGHENIGTTQVYVDVLPKGRQQAARAHPRQG